MYKPGYFRLMRLIMGFRESKILLVANDLDLFSELSKGARTVESLAKINDLDARALEILMNALTAMGVISQKDGFYSNQEIAEKYLVKGQPDYLGQFFKFLNLCWDRWSNLAKTLKPGYAPVPTSSSIKEELQFSQAFIWGMDNIAAERAKRIAQMLDFGAVRRMLDLGGGAATYSIAFAEQNPRLNAVVLDLPSALSVARENIQIHGLSNRIHTLEGSYWDLDYGSDYDVVWISQVIHSLNESQAFSLIRKSVQALSSNGRLIVHDSFLAEDHASPYYAALFSALMLSLSDGGRCYDFNEIREWLAQVGLINIQRIELDAESEMAIGIKA
jgi:ubiquinone/menaquinone biosynthesis C-methylase UbiE